MKCDRCNNTIPTGEENRHLGQCVCEDCYMDLLSPAKPCDPWAVHSAKSMAGDDVILTRRQKKILALVKESSGIAPQELAQKMELRMKDLEREIATLRHMEKTRMAMVEGKKILCLWH